MKNLVQITFKTILLTFIYLISVIVLTGVLIGIGIPFPAPRVDSQTSMLQLLVSGFICASFAVYLMRKYDLTKYKAFFIVFFILFCCNMSVAIEGHLFTPEYITKGVLLSLLVQQFLVSGVFSALGVVLFRKKLSEGKTEKSFSINKALVAVLLISALVYTTLYYVFGWLNYNIITKSFYEAGISGLAIPDGSVLWKIIFVRGILIAVSILPFLLYAQPDNKLKKSETGMILFVFGGLIPMILNVGVFPADFIVYSLIEIFLQNFIAGIVIYLILKKKDLLTHDRNV